DGVGTASLSTAALALGSHSITVSYAGDSNFTASTSPALTQVVSASLTATSTALASSAATTVYGQAVTFTSTVSPGSGSGTPTGTVTFLDGSATLGAAPLNAQGQAVFTTTLLGVGGHAVTAVYGGDASYTPSTSAAVSQTVNQATTTTNVSSSN